MDRLREKEGDRDRRHKEAAAVDELCVSVCGDEWHQIHTQKDELLHHVETRRDREKSVEWVSDFGTRLN